MRRIVVVVVILCAVSTFGRDVKEIGELKQQIRSRRHAPVAMAATKQLRVDCTKGEKIQDAVDKNDAPLDITVTGICVESVYIERKNFTLRGANALLDGIDGSTASALAVRDVSSGTVENLSLIDSPGAGFRASDSAIQMTDCRVSGNTTGIQANEDTVLVADRVTLTSNGRGIVVDDARFVACRECDVSGNASWAGASSRGGMLTFLDSAVSGPRGIIAQSGGYADFDCDSHVSTHPCTTQLTQIAGFAHQDGHAYMWLIGDFTGRLNADERGQVAIIGSRQLSSSPNVISAFGTFVVDPGNTPSQVRTTVINSFGRMIVRGQATVDGSIQCSAAGDAWLDSDTIAAPGSSITGCEHGTLP